MEEGLQNILTNIVGLRANHVNYIGNQGVINSTEFVGLDDATFTEMLNKPSLATVTIVMRMRLHVFMSWLQSKYAASHDEPDLHLFTPAVIDKQQLRLVRKKPSESKDKISSKEASPPEKFNGCAQSWKIWKSEFEAFLAQLHGYNGTALIYVILDDEDLTDDAYEAMNQPMHDMYDHLTF